MTLAKNRPAAIITLFVTLCAGPWGCATRARPAPEASSEAVLPQLGVVGVPAVRVAPYVRLRVPEGKGSGALKGAGYGLVGGATPGLAIASLGAQCGGAGPLVCVALGAVGLGVAVAGGTIGAIGGTVYGAIAAEPAKRVAAAEAALRKAFDDPAVHAALRDQVLRVAREHGSPTVVALEEHELDGANSYLALAVTRGVDTLLELDAVSIELDGRGINPAVRLVMTASPRLVRTTDGAQLHWENPEYRRNFEYQSLNANKLVEWAANDGRVFRDEVERGAQVLAGDIVRMLLQSATARAPESVTPSPEPDAEGAEGTLLGP